MDSSCGSGTVMTGLQSTHNDGYNDRRWKRQCTTIYVPPVSSSNSWTGENNFHQQFWLECPANKAVVGIQSAFSSEDRVFNLKCSRLGGDDWSMVVPGGSWSGFLNEFETDIDHQCGVGYVMTGLYSTYHDPGKSRHTHDRKFKMKCGDARSFSTTAARQLSEPEAAQLADVETQRSAFAQPAEGLGAKAERSYSDRRVLMERVRAYNQIQKMSTSNSD
jgi:hypothetical protein